MRGYTARDVARMLDLSPSQVRSYARAGFLQPKRGGRREYRFTFQDLVLLRTAKELIAARIPSRKIRRALSNLKAQLPSGRPLSAVQIAADGDRISVRDGRSVWNPESGQALFDFEVSELAEKAEPLARRAADEARSAAEELGPEEWYDLGCDLEMASLEQARDAYRRALELDPALVEARVNLGRLLHEAGMVEAAEAHYRLAMTARPGDATAAFNLGVSLEDLGREDEAVKAYEMATASDPEMADGHFNLARLLEKRGDPLGALRHLKAYRRLLQQR